MPTPVPPPFFKTYILPAFITLIIPLLGLAFTSYELGKWSQEASSSMRESLEKAVASPEGLEPEKLVRAEAYLQSYDIGEEAFQRCGRLGFFEKPEHLGESFCLDVLQFAWIRFLSKLILLLIALVALSIGGGLWWVSRTPKDQQRGFMLAWTSLRALGVPLILFQGLCAVFLSFWVTAIFFHMYSVKLVGIAAVVALGAVAAAIMGLFARSEFTPMEHGHVLKRGEAPEFEAGIAELAAKVGTQPPDNVVVGIDDNFFVTEMPLSIFSQYPSRKNPAPQIEQLSGRTMYVSLSLMRALKRDEVSAILAHELAHFLSKDTQQSQKLVPLLRRFAAYLEALQAAALFGVPQMMVAFRASFERMSMQFSRAAEFAADAVSASVLGTDAAGRALMKVAAYGAYRADTEESLFNSMTGGQGGIAERVNTGFASFMGTPTFRERLMAENVPHPFASHPPMGERLEKLQVTFPDAQALAALTESSNDTWCSSIPTAEVLEKELWSAYEERFQERHDFYIALRLLPQTPEEVAHVERHFPALTLPCKGGEVALDWRALTLVDGRRVAWSEVKTAAKKDVTFKGECLVATTAGDDVTLVLGHFSTEDREKLMGAFGSLWQRDQAAREHAKKEASPAA